jgi:triacylglycerol lipase
MGHTKIEARPSGSPSVRAVALAACMVLGATRAAAAPRGYTQTAHPIVLVHGMLGFDRVFDVYTYWFGIIEALQRGGAEVYVLSVSPLSSTTARAEQALAQIETILAVSGHTRVNLIGHSQGGLDARYVATVRPDLVASVTTVSTPHTGAALADHLLTGPRASGDTLVLRALEVLGPLVSVVSGHAGATDVAASLGALSSPGVAAFNRWSPAGLPPRPCGGGAPRAGGTYLFSWGGVGVVTNPLDALDALWQRTVIHDAGASDGLVSRCSTHFGRVLRDDYIANHLDTINQVFGLVSPTGPNPVQIYRAHANRLARLGL